MQLRCESKLHGVLVDGLVEIKCSSRFCGSDGDTAVLHYFDPLTGELVKTKRFKEPATAFNKNRQKENLQWH